MSGDNWIHRAKNMRCRTCQSWVRKDGTVLGRCRRHAPELGGWPAVFEDDWCGDHKLDSAHVDKNAGPEPCGKPDPRAN